MTKEQMDSYKLRITQAGVGELTVIMLEMEIQWIEEALLAYSNGDEPVLLDCLEKAQVVQQHLMNILNLDNAVARDVYSVFVYINKQLITARIKKETLDLNRLKEVLHKYLVSFREIAKTDEEGPVMLASEKVYAGLTYGSGGLVESSIGGMDFTI
ncbi:MAG: flagellar protein FliS [Lachnospiraceae bacterium]